MERGNFVTQSDDGLEADTLRLIASNHANLMANEASPYLEPEDSPFSPTRRGAITDYELLVAESLRGAEECEARSLAPGWQLEETAGLACGPSFEAEWMLWVVGERTAGFGVLLLEAETSMWYSDKSGPEMFHQPLVKKHRAEFAKDLGGAVCDVWSSVTSQTRYPRKLLDGRCDGVTYHFVYSRKGLPATAGKAWSPVETTIPGKLAALAHSVRDYVRDPENQDAFLQAVKDHFLWFQSSQANVPRGNQASSTDCYASGF